MCMQYLRRSEKVHHIPWNRSYKWLLVMWVLEIELMWSGRVASALNSRPHFLFETQSL